MTRSNNAGLYLQYTARVKRQTLHDIILPALFTVRRMRCEQARRFLSIPSELVPVSLTLSLSLLAFPKANVPPHPYQLQPPDLSQFLRPSPALATIAIHYFPRNMHPDHPRYPTIPLPAQTPPVTLLLTLQPAESPHCNSSIDLLPFLTLLQRREELFPL